MLSHLTSVHLLLTILTFKVRIDLEPHTTRSNTIRSTTRSITRKLRFRFRLPMMPPPLPPPPPPKPKLQLQLQKRPRRLLKKRKPRRMLHQPKLKRRLLLIRRLR
jgi:hypothetical protein